MWKYRTTCAEERATRLLQFRERNVKNAHDRTINNDKVKGHVGIESFANKRGTRSRLSDTLNLLTEPMWESDLDPNVEWIVLKVPRRNRSFFIADFVDGDVMDEKDMTTTFASVFSSFPFHDDISTP
jgi:hypothetical protein